MGQRMRGLDVWLGQEAGRVAISRICPSLDNGSPSSDGQTIFKQSAVSDQTQTQAANFWKKEFVAKTHVGSIENTVEPGLT